MTTENAQDSSQTGSQKATQFKPSGFQKSRWEVVSDAPPSEAFTAMAVEALQEGVRPKDDPLFERYDDLLREEVGPSLAAGNDDEEPHGQTERALEQIEVRHREELEALKAEFAAELEQTRIAAVELGRGEAREECDARLRMLSERYNSVIEDMNSQIRESVESVERRAVDFALQVSKKLIGTAVEINPEYLLEVIKEAIKLTGGANIKSIRVSPQDMEFLKMLSPERQFKEFDGSWSFQTDDSIRAGCVVETTAGQVDCDLEKAWDRIREHVVKVR
jgi:flagellar biosynthesis/type III secretory pathway protein FliH